MCRLIPFAAAIVLAATATEVRLFAQNARLDPESETAQSIKPDDQGSFFLPTAESKAVVATATAAAYNEAGTAAYSNKRYEDAIAAFRGSINEDPNRSAVHTNLSVALSKVGRIREAIAEAREAVRLDPQSAGGRSVLCSLLLTTGDGAAATPCFDELLKVRPGDVAILAERSSAIFLSGKKKEGIASMTQLVQKYPSYGDGHNLLGVMLHQTHETKRALDELRAAVSIDPASATYRFNLALVQLASNDKAGALSQYRFLKESSSELADSLYRQIYGDKVVFVGK